MLDRSTPARGSTRRARAAVAALVTLGLVAAACGGDDDDDSADATDAPAATDAAAATDPPAGTDAPADTTGDTSGGDDVAGKVTDFLAYVGGPGGEATGEPIKVGYINQDGGAIVVSATHDDGVDIAVKYINEEAGGIGGRPIEIVQCFIANAEEEGQQCGQQFANDDEIVAVLTGPTVTGTQSFYAALAESKPVISGVSVNPVDTRQPNAAVLNGGAMYILAPFATFAKDVLGVESAALVYSEETQSDAAAGQASAFEALGIPIKVQGYPSNTADLTQPLLAVDAQNADIVMPVMAAPECVKFAEAQRALGIPDDKVLASPVCLSPATIEGLGDFPQWYYAITSSLGTDTNDPSVPPYQEILISQGQDQYIPDPWVLVGFAQALTLAQWMNELGADNVTPDGILEQMKAFTGPLVLGSPELQCGKYDEAPGVCGDHTQFYKYNGENQFEHVGDFVPPPEGWEAPR